ncbi:sugar ABC transporter ATP-binding protein [Neomoorella humiferrea]|uniref:Ribose import ATP-binding protein RbsA n=1 Tax=Neomoorella humiferrea TaxID=676965 RepID=A0A2T0ANA9_9FIRM|nr:sugar ABC transporter ATP-binding protein [Moorella humiferrea]PRR70438.1 Ribose import ATP-binding protein RbsA [Moorella humiferrea]
MSRKPFLQMKNISKTFPGVRALDEVQLEILPGEVHALVGENGAGKSTLIKILAGVEQPDPGAEILIDGHPVNIRQPIDANQQGIAVIYQDFSLFPNLTVAENISFGKEIGLGKRLVNWNEIKETATKALAELGIELDLNLQLERLPVAKQQLVAIARALAFNARFIIMDEPTSSLSRGEVENLFKIIATLKEKGIAILFVSHRLQELFTIAERFTVLRDGKYIGTYLKEELNEDKLISLMVGRKIEFVKQSRSSPGPVLLEVKSITKKGNFKDISFTLHKGEILGLTGLVGAGRTEVAQALFGLNVPESGEIFLEGVKVNIHSPEEAMGLGIAYIPEGRQREGLVLRQSVAQNVSLAVLKKLRSKFGLLNAGKERQLVEEYMEALDIRPRLPNMLAMQLSGGNQQKVVLAKWLATHPKVLIIDEPTNGIDVGAKAEIHKLLKRLAEQGMGIIMISSELPEILAVSDRVLVMRRGRLVGEFAIEEATQEKIMNKAFMGTPGKATA